ncbi:uncharacterized protein METZ01_LOCUS517314 [marine metagenome]|uniref:Uncharacterized protein n=1 Tax=marine metagenome TaxID=408172 RepID=A0A383F728_9ZZZZ
MAKALWNSQTQLREGDGERSSVTSMGICCWGFLEMADVVATRTVFTGPTVASL